MLILLCLMFFSAADHVTLAVCLCFLLLLSTNPHSLAILISMSSFAHHTPYPAFQHVKLPTHTKKHTHDRFIIITSTTPIISPKISNCVLNITDHYLTFADLDIKPFARPPPNQSFRLNGCIDRQTIFFHNGSSTFPLSLTSCLATIQPSEPPDIHDPLIYTSLTCTSKDFKHSVDAFSDSTVSKIEFIIISRPT